MKSKLKTAWGFDGIIVSTEKYAVRVVLIDDGERTPYGYNKKQDKTLFVLQGVVQVNIEGTTRTLNEGERYHIRPRVKHSIHATKAAATVLEIGTKLEDDFIESI